MMQMKDEDFLAMEIDDEDSKLFDKDPVNYDHVVHLDL